MPSSHMLPRSGEDVNGLFCTPRSWKKRRQKRHVPKVGEKCHADEYPERTVERSKNSRGRGKHLSKKKLKGSGALQLSALLRQSQHTPAKLFLNNHPAVLKAVKSSLFLCVLLPLFLSVWGAGAVWTVRWFHSDKDSCWQVEVRRGCSTVWGFRSGHFVPCVETSPVRMMMFLSASFVHVSLVLQLKKKKEKLRKIFMISLHGWKILKGYA